MPAASIPFVNGKDAKLRLFVNGTEVILTAKTWSVKSNVTKYADGVDGEDRDRLGRVVNYFELAANCFQAGTTQLDAVLADVANDDTQVPPLVKAAGVRLKLIDGTRVSYVAKELILDDFDFNQAGRGDRVMFTLNMRFRYFTKTKSA